MSSQVEQLTKHLNFVLKYKDVEKYRQYALKL